MADRLTVITELGTLINEARQRGDDRAVASLRDALQLIDDYGAVDRALGHRRTADAERQRRRREKETESHVSHVTSRESRDGSQGFPGPLPNSPSNTTTTPLASVVESDLDDLTALTWRTVKERMGALVVDVEAFLMRRDASTWHSWLKEILVALNGTATADDVAGTCRDDGALERRIGSPGGFRVFVRKSTEERILGPRREQNGVARAVSRRAASGSTPAPVSDPNTPIKW